MTTTTPTLAELKDASRAAWDAYAHARDAAWAAYRFADRDDADAAAAEKSAWKAACAADDALRAKAAAAHAATNAAADAHAAGTAAAEAAYYPAHDAAYAAWREPPDAVSP